jgi:hypothetical protein
VATLDTTGGRAIVQTPNNISNQTRRAIASEPTNVYGQLGVALQMPRVRPIWELSTADLSFLKGATVISPRTAEHEDILFRLKMAAPQLVTGGLPKPQGRVWALASGINAQVAALNISVSVSGLQLNAACVSSRCLLQRMLRMAQANLSIAG